MLGPHTHNMICLMPFDIWDGAIQRINAQKGPSAKEELLNWNGLPWRTVGSPLLEVVTCWVGICQGCFTHEPSATLDDPWGPLQL